MAASWGMLPELEEYERTEYGYTECYYTRSGVWMIGVRWRQPGPPDAPQAYEYWRRTSDESIWNRQPDIHTHLRCLWSELYRLASDPLV
jgi:hypothetical protein